MRSDGLVNLCSNCRHSFLSAHPVIYSSNVAQISRGNMEQCPKCRAMIPSPDFHTVKTKYGMRPLRAGDSITHTGRRNSDPDNPSKYIGVRSGGRLSLTWRIWSAKNKDDLYISCLALPSWKISLHTSGDDNVSFINDANLTVNEGFDIIGKRHIYKATRQMPMAANAIRVVRVDVKGEIPLHYDWASELKEKHRKDLLIIDDTVHERAGFEIYYTEGDPLLYQETSLIGCTALVQYKLNNNEWFSLTPCLRPLLGETPMTRNLPVIRNGKVRAECQFGPIGTDPFEIAIRHIG